MPRRPPMINSDLWSRIDQNSLLMMFDLDGTLSNSARGILASLRYAFAANGLPPLDADAERSVLGPPFHEALPPFLGEVPLSAVKAAYIESYRAGAMFDTSVYDGIPAVLEGLSARGVRMAVATSKPEYTAEPIVAHLGLSRFFQTICGDTLDGTRGSKALVIAEVLDRLGSPAPSEVLMVGDRRHDVEGARAHGVRCIGAGWGYAVPGELAAAGADPICTTPAELAACLGLDVDATAS